MADLTAADVAAMINSKESGGIFDGDGLIILLLFFLFAGGGMFGNNACGEALTRAEMSDGFNMSNLQGDVKANGAAICNGFNEVNRNIDQTRYESAQNTCAITSAIHADGEATRELITANEMQALRDKLAEKDNLLQSANLTLANAAQTQNILNNMGRYVPYQGCGTSCNCTGIAQYNW